MGHIDGILTENRPLSELFCDGKESIPSHDGFVATEIEWYGDDSDIIKMSGKMNGVFQDIFIKMTPTLKRLLSSKAA